MTKRHIIISFIVMTLFSSMTEAEVISKPSTPVHLSAEKIVEKNVAARGGLQAWRAVQSMSMSGKLDAGRLRDKVPSISNTLRKVKLDVSKPMSEGKIIQLPFTMEMKRPLKLRVEVLFQGETAVQVYDGNNGWKLRPFIGRHEVEAYTPDEMKSAAQQQQLDGFLIDYAVKGTKVTEEGVELVDGKYAYKLKLTLKDGQIRHTWVDAQTFLEVKIDDSRRMDGKPRSVMTYLSNYQSVNGLMVPYTLETSVEGVKDSERILVEKVSMNPQLADSRFAKPI